MANPDHVALARKGAMAIAEWRQKHPKERLDLTGADLSRADLSDGDLSGADLSRANLSGAIFRNANLSAANMREATLKWADLGGANLSKANLNGATLHETTLTGANLSGAWLIFANIVAARLGGARLSQAQLAYTSMVHLDLSKVTALGTVIHKSPSSIGVDTLIASFRGAGNKLTPELMTFFRGAGVPQELLDALPAIVAEAKHYTCFISYGQHDLEFAKKLTEDLRGNGVSCWLWDTDKTVGEPTQQEIERKLEEYEKMVVLCSIYSLLGNGIRREIDRQLAKDATKLVPISLENGWKHKHYVVECFGRDLKPFLLDKNYADFANKPYDEALAELLKGLRRP